MPINPNIALGAQPQQPVNMLGQVGQMLALKAATEEMRGNEDLRAAYAQGGDLNDPEFRRKVMAANPRLGSQLIKTNAETGKLQNEAIANRIKLSREMLTGVNTPEDYIAWHEANHKDPVLGNYLNQRGVTAEQSRAKIIADLSKPGGLDKLKRESALGATELQKELMQTERSRISAAPGHRQATLAETIYQDKLKAGGDIVTSTVPDPEKPGERIEMQFRRDLRTGHLVPLEIQQPPMRVDISPSSATSAYVPSGAGGAGGETPNVLATQVAPQGGAAPVVNALNPNAPAPATQGPIFARPKTTAPSGTLAGYRKTPEGNLEFIPGGPADPAVQARQTGTKLSEKDIQTREAKFPQATTALKGFEAKTNKFERDIDELIKNEKGLNEITGFLAGRTDLSAMSQAGRRALALFNTITAKGGFSELQDMRNSSPTGGALGNVSNQEGKQLIDAVGALSRTQNADDLRKSLATLKTDLQGSKQRVKEAYDLTYEYRGSSGGVPALPPGFKPD